MTDQNDGLLVYFDGPDGVGKTIQLELAADKLKKEGHQVYVTRTLGGTPIGEMLREAILSNHMRPVEADFHIVLASYHALLESVISRRDKGEVVLIDRSPLSIIGYQVYGDGLDSVAGYEAVTEILDLYQPDLIITYTASPRVLSQRRQQRIHGERHNYFEDKSLDYHQKVADGFKAAVHQFGGKVVDASQDVDSVHQATMRLIYQLLQP